MPVARFEMPDGRIARFEVAEGTTPEQAQALISQQVAATQQQSAQPTQPQAPAPSFYDRLRESLMGGLSPVPGAIGGAAEVAGTFASGAVAEPVAGIAGIVQSLNPFAQPGAGAQAVNDVRQAMTYMPRTESGQGQIRAVGEALAPVANAMNAAQNYTGEAGYELAGPVGGAVGAAIPAAAMELAGLAAGRVLGRGAQVARAVPDDQAQSILRASKQFDVPVLTSDVRPPQGYTGRFLQGLSEKLGVLGTGQARASQQGAREAAVKGFAEAMDIDLDSPFAADIVNSVKGTIKAEISAAGRMRDEAVRVLDPAGVVPLTNTKAATARVIAKQAALKEKGNSALVENIGRIERSLEDGNFTQLKNIRTEVIDDIKALVKAEDSRAVADLESVKKAIDKDMLRFAARTDPEAAKKWVKSNRAFADAYTRSKDSELKRLIMNGELTPEKVTPLIRGGRPSELNRLYQSMDATGREAARKAIIQDALKDARFFETDANPNPDAFATALNRANRQQAINVFFRGNAKEELDGLARLLNATRRAQQGATVTKTGEQIVPILSYGGLGAGLATNPVGTAAIVGSASMLLKAYESRPFRGLMLKLGNTKPGTLAEKRLLDLAATVAAGGSQAAIERQEAEQ